MKKLLALSFLTLGCAFAQGGECGPCEGGEVYCCNGIYSTCYWGCPPKNCPGDCGCPGREECPPPPGGYVQQLRVKQPLRYCGGPNFHNFRMVKKLKPFRIEPDVKLTAQETTPILDRILRWFWPV